jgi:hypothetical protein
MICKLRVFWYNNENWNTYWTIAQLHLYVSIQA